MTGSAPQLGVLLLLAVLLQTAVVTITVLHFTSALSSVRSQSGFGTARRVDASRTGSVRMSDRLLRFCFCFCFFWGGRMGGGRIINHILTFNTSRMHGVTFISCESLQGSSALFLLWVVFTRQHFVCASWSSAHLDPGQPDVQEPIFSPEELTRKFRGLAISAGHFSTVNANARTVLSIFIITLDLDFL